MKGNNKYLPPFISFLFLFICTGLVQAQGELRWMVIGPLQQYFSELGANYEGARSLTTGCDGMAWPAEYGFVEMSNMNSDALMIGCVDYYDPVRLRTFDYKVIGHGPRNHSGVTDEIFPIMHKLIARTPPPLVQVGGTPASQLAYFDQIDSLNENLPCDRMILTQFHTSIGITVTKKVMAFSQQNHNNYFIEDYVFKNTGIIDAAGTHYSQSIKGCYFLFDYRWAFSGESVSAYQQGWGIWDATWGRNTINQVIRAEHPVKNRTYRATYAWYGPFSTRTVTDDWGCPNETANLDDNLPDEILASAEYAGVITLHADRSVSDNTDDSNQPAMTQYTDSDNDVYLFNRTDAEVQYDPVLMQKRYVWMASGHPEVTMADAVGDQFVDVWSGSVAGYSQNAGYGPYDLLNEGDSIHIVIARAVNGMSREKNREVARNWLIYDKNRPPLPTLTLPNGSTTTDHDLYKRTWVKSGEDSLLKTFDLIWNTWQNGIDNIPQSPPAPAAFTVKAGGGRIFLTWTAEAESDPNFDGYQICRSLGTLNTPNTIYEQIFECSGGTDLVNSYADTSALIGTKYYYYIVSKNDGSNNDVSPGVPLVSSKFYTMTSEAARPLQNAGTSLDQIRIVPNPFIISQRLYQWPGEYEYDQIAFWNIPALCKIKIFTERGDLVWQKDHQDYSGAEYWYSVTSSGQIIASGIYIVYFEVTQNIYDESTHELLFARGQNTFRKFIVIR